MNKETYLYSLKISSFPFTIPLCRKRSDEIPAHTSSKGHG